MNIYTFVKHVKVSLTCVGICICSEICMYFNYNMRETKISAESLAIYKGKSPITDS